MKRTSFVVAMSGTEDNPPTEHRVTLMLADQLRGELEGKKLGIDLSLPVHTSALWVWSAMVRLGHYAGTFQEFKGACIDYEKVDGEQADVPPTSPAASGDSA